MNSFQINNDQDLKNIPNPTVELKFTEIEDKTDQIYQKITQEEGIFKPIELPIFENIKHDFTDETFVFSSNEEELKCFKKINHNEDEFDPTIYSSEKLFTSLEFGFENFNLKTEQKNTSIFDLYENLLTAPWTKDVKEFFTGANGIFSDIQPNGRFDVQYQCIPKIVYDGYASILKLYKDKVIDLDHFEREYLRILKENMPKVCPFEIKLSKDEQRIVDEFNNEAYFDQQKMKMSNPELCNILDVTNLIELKPKLESELYTILVDRLEEDLKNERSISTSKTSDMAQNTFSLDFESQFDFKLTIPERQENFRKKLDGFYNIMGRIIKYRLQLYSYTFNLNNY